MGNRVSRKIRWRPRVRRMFRLLINQCQSAEALLADPAEDAIGKEESPWGS